jgi:hypothetical protein
MSEVKSVQPKNVLEIPNSEFSRVRIIVFFKVSEPDENEDVLLSRSFGIVFVKWHSVISFRVIW